MTVDAEVQRLIDAAVNPLAAEIADLQDRVLALEAEPDPVPPGSGITTDVPAGWKETVRQDFLIDCVEGGFAIAYPQASSKIGFYPRGYFDTRWKQNRANGQAIRGGEYSADFISVAGSVCKQRMWVRNNVVQCSALVPLAVPANGKWGDAPGMIYEHRSKFTYTDGLKSAHLLWPQSDKSLPDGEIDYPEFQVADLVDCFIHHQGATSGSDQKQLTTMIKPNEWHTYRLVWVMGKSVTIFCDGIQVGTYATKIPATPMHLVLQNESWLDTRPVPATAQGTIETDWIRVLVPA